MALRVLVAEDSVVARMLIVGILRSDPDLTVVGQAGDGEEAVRLAAELDPDVITMDVHMPKMDGLKATRSIMEQTPKPIVIVSANDPKDMQQSFRALQAGALSVLGKPKGPSSPEFPAQSAELVRTVKLMAEMKVIRRARRGDAPRSAPASPAAPAARPRVGGASAARSAAPPTPVRPVGRSAAPGATPRTRPATAESPAVAPLPGRAGLEGRRIELVAVGCSTGGPAALGTILSALPAPAPVPIVVVQHISTGFDRGLVNWLNSVSTVPVRLAEHGQALRAGEVVVAPCDHHATIDARDRTVRLDEGPPVGGHRPSATTLFHSVARSYGASVLGVILTGMGEDGAEGLLAMRAAGARVLAQDKETSVVFGMPGAAVAKGAVHTVAPLGEIAELIGFAWSRGRTGAAA